MKPGQIVYSKINMQPLAIGDRGVIKKINYGVDHPVMVKWDKLQHILPMKWDEIK